MSCVLHLTPCRCPQLRLRVETRLRRWCVWMVSRESWGCGPSLRTQLLHICQNSENSMAVATTSGLFFPLIESPAGITVLEITNPSIGFIDQISGRWGMKPSSDTKLSYPNLWMDWDTRIDTRYATIGDWEVENQSLRLGSAEHEVGNEMDLWRKKATVLIHFYSLPFMCPLLLLYILQPFSPAAQERAGPKPMRESPDGVHDSELVL